VSIPDFVATLIFPAPQYSAGDWTSTGFSYEDVYFKTEDGVQLNAWFLDEPNRFGHAFYFHGAATNVAMVGPAVSKLRERLRLAILLVDYRGYGKSGGTPSEEGVFADARAASAWMCRRCGLSSSELILMVYSLGGAVAIDLAAAQGARAIVLQNTFSSLGEVFERHAPAGLQVQAQFESMVKISRYRGPVLFSHGTQDVLVPVDLALRLFGAHRGQKQFFCSTGITIAGRLRSIMRVRICSWVSSSRTQPASGYSGCHWSSCTLRQSRWSNPGHKEMKKACNRQPEKNARSMERG
jgi:fermentation-respiration switch protein FrsA (DUF1100 family)